MGLGRPLAWQARLERLFITVVLLCTCTHNGLELGSHRLALGSLVRSKSCCCAVVRTPPRGCLPPLLHHTTTAALHCLSVGLLCLRTCRPLQARSCPPSPVHLTVTVTCHHHHLCTSLTITITTTCAPHSPSPSPSPVHLTVTCLCPPYDQRLCLTVTRLCQPPGHASPSSHPHPQAIADSLVPTITCTSSNVVQTTLQAFAQVCAGGRAHAAYAQHALRAACVRLCPRVHKVHAECMPHMHRTGISTS